MGNYQYKFEKILSIREKEKQRAYTKFSQAKKQFEEVAGKLYKLLKKKEDLHLFQETKLAEGMPIQEIRHHQMFMDNLEKMIAHYQQEVIQARERMNLFQEVLMDKNIEVKKYEKIREKEFARYQEMEKLDEKNNMDDISIQLFLSKEK